MDDLTQQSKRQVRFVAVGGVWLDEIRNTEGPIVKDAVGGSVAFATLGARLFAHDKQSIHLVVRAGNDFPPRVLDVFRSWKVSLTVQLENDSPSARGVIHYGGKDGSDRIYERLTLPLLTTPDEHLTLEQIVHAKCFHFFTTPEVIEKQASLIRDIRDAMTEIHGNQPPLLIWEPQAKSCSPGTLQRHIEAFGQVDVFSPNHVELHSLYSETKITTVDRKKVESAAMSFLKASTAHRGAESKSGYALIVRAAEHGCYVLWNAAGSPTGAWLPAYYDRNSSKVVDPTGAGNAFLGGFAVGFQETGDFVQAAMYGQIAASLVIEQIGVPELRGQAENETWNGVHIRQRLSAYRRQLQQSGQSR